MIRLGSAKTKRYEVHGFVLGRGFTARLYDAVDQREAAQAFRNDFPKGQTFWTALTPEHRGELGCGCQVDDVKLGLHTTQERVDALKIAHQAYADALAWLERGKLKFATEKLGFLQGISALANREGEPELVKALDQMLLDLGSRLSEAWKTA